MKIPLPLLAALALCFCSAPTASSHPHVFVDCALTLVFDDEGLAGFEQHWVMDEMYSSTMLEEYDPDGSSVQGESKLQEVRDIILEGFREYHYYTRVLVDEEERPMESMEDFSMTVENGRLVYDFYLPCPVRASSEACRVMVSLHDETYYKLLTLPTDAIAYRGDEGLEIQHSFEKVERFRYYYDQIVPLGVSVRFRDKASAEGSGGAKAESSVSFPQRFLSRINAWQKEIKSRLTRFARDIRKNPYGKPLGLFLLLSFVYGVLHALGPGHGKSIVCSYFLSRPGKALHGTLMANLITFVHVGSAVTTVLIFYFLFKARGMTSFENASVVLQKASYALLALLGLALAAHKIHELKAMKGKRFGECGSQEARYKSLVAVALATGLVPCPGAAIILIFSITLKILVPGLLAMVCIAVGMGLTTSLFALAAIKSRDALFRWTSRGERLFSISYAVVSLGGALIITIMGVALFLQT